MQRKLKKMTNLCSVRAKKKTFDTYLYTLKRNSKTLHDSIYCTLKIGLIKLQMTIVSTAP
jgi:uncharacterized protein YcgL (UPF0745 family)